MRKGSLAWGNAGTGVCCLSNPPPWNEPVCPCQALCPSGEEEDEGEGLTSLIQNQMAQRTQVLAPLGRGDTDPQGWGSPWLWGVHTPQPIHPASTWLVPRLGAEWAARMAARRQSLPTWGLPCGCVQARCCDPRVTVLSFYSFLLTAVALLSSYSIHLLLKSSGIVGECRLLAGLCWGIPS